MNIAVVTVIHQPSFEIFSQYHHVYILSKVGKCVFSGTPKCLEECLIDYNYESSNSNPADIIISIASCVSEEDDEVIDAPNDVEGGRFHSGSVKSTTEMKQDCEEMMKNFAENWTRNAYAKTGENIQTHGLSSSGAEFKLYCLWVLLKRTSLTSLLRQKRLIFIRLALHLVVEIVLAVLYNRDIGKVADCYMPGFNRNCSTEVDLRTESVPNQNVKFQFFTLLFLMFAALMPLMPTVLTFPAEIKVSNSTI